MTNQDDVRNARELDEGLIAAEENLVIDVQFLIQELLNEKGLTRTDLARLSGVSKARLTQMMRSEANPTLRTLAKVFHVLGDRLEVSRGSKVLEMRGIDPSLIDLDPWDVETVISRSETVSRRHSRSWLSEEIRRYDMILETQAVNENFCLEVHEYAVAAA
jgi:transcriptional regulator with XRE-family HTH domain